VTRKCRTDPSAPTYPLVIEEVLNATAKTACASFAANPFPIERGMSFEYDIENINYTFYGYIVTWDAADYLDLSGGRCDAGAPPQKLVPEDECLALFWGDWKYCEPLPSILA
jgi:hypothetical protein